MTSSETIGMIVARVVFTDRIRVWFSVRFMMNR